MTLREMNLRVFQRRPIPHVFFQPRFEPWVAWNRQFGTLPAELADLELRQIYDRVGASMRSVNYYTGQPGVFESGYCSAIKVTSRRDGGLQKVRYDTPAGSLFETHKLTVDQAWRTIEFKAKSPDDLPALRALFEHHYLAFSPVKYRVGKDYVGDRGEAHFWVPKSPYLCLAQQHFRYEDFIYALTDRPAEIEDLFRVIDESYDRMYEQLAANGGGPQSRQGAMGRPGLVNIVNFGENVAIAHMSPAYFEKYLMPWYDKRVNQLKRAGIFTHIHIDGFFRPLLRYLRHLPFDGLEALTPRPQGDVTLEEIKEHIGDKILLDGIPAVLFLEHHSPEQLHECVEKVVRLFHPRLVLGISDELPEGGRAEAFERLKWVAEYARTHGGH